jgi:hypothetical protein
MISLSDICMKPLDQDCATQSVLQVKLVVCIWVVHIIECSDGTCKTFFLFSFHDMQLTCPRPVPF